VQLEALEDDDVVWLRDRIARHLGATGSAVAQRILSNWDIEVDLFLKVMPTDYKRVLEAMRRAELEGRPVDEAVMEASHG
jgi:glutamate synthase (NADPH/NADH) large chain